MADGSNITLIDEAKARFPSICEALFGPCVEKNGAEHRYSWNPREGVHKGGRSLCINHETGDWYSHSEKKGGRTKTNLFGLIEFGLQTEDRKEATKWLYNFLYGRITPRRMKAPAQNPKARRQSIKDFTHEEGCAADSENFTTVSYPYRDEFGKLRYVRQRVQCLGCGRKRFSAGRVEAGHFSPGMGDAEPLPYRLDHWYYAANPIVYIVEGEKIADAMASAEGVNTTSVHKWTPEVAQFFRGFEVVLIPDFDDPGQAQARAAVEALKDVAYAVYEDACYRIAGVEKDDAFDDSFGDQSPYWQPSKKKH